MSEADNSKEQTDNSPNTTEATVEAPKETPEPQAEAPKVEEKATPPPEQKPKTKKTVKQEIDDGLYKLKKTVTYINEFGKEIEATVTKSFPIGNCVGKKVEECTDNEVIHHLTYFENGFQKIVRSVHHINTRPAMDDGKRICVWK